MTAVPPPAEGRRPGTIEGWETRRPIHVTRRGGSWKGIVFVLFMVGVLATGAWVILGPIVRSSAVEMFQGNPSAIRWPFVADLLAVELAGRIGTPAGTDERPLEFVVEEGQNPAEIEDALVEAGLLTDRLAFEYLLVSQDVEGLVTAGTYTMDRTITPRELVDRLKGSPDPVTPRVTIALKDGLRIEQVVAYLQTLGLQTDLKEFHRLVSEPPQGLIEEYDFLSLVPSGNSLEGFLSGVIEEVPVDIAPLDLARMLLDEWQAEIGPEIARARKQKRDFYEVLTLASLVERETGLDAERARIAGVYTNRLDEGLNPTRIMNADPTVLYAVDTKGLRDIGFGKWQDFAFWTTVDESLAAISVPPDLRSFQTYVEPGLPDWPIATPSLESVQAVLAPDRRKDFLYFYACPGEKRHVFARTLAQHERNIARCQ